NPGLPAVHVRLYRRPQGGDGHARKPLAQLRVPRPRVRTLARERVAVLAPHFPRHGAGLGHHSAAVHRPALLSDVAGVLSHSPGPLAPSRLTLPSDPQRRAQTPLPTLRPP